MHPPIPPEGVLGEVASYQADLASGQERKNTRILEWFGPPEHNTLRPLCVVLLVLSEVENKIVRSESQLVLCLASLGLVSV